MHVQPNVPSEVFLAPLIKMKADRQELHDELVRRNVDLAAQLRQMVKENKALPTYARIPHSFQLENLLHDVTANFNQLRDTLNSVLTDYGNLAQNALKLDARYREDALRLVYECEQEVRSSIKTIEGVIEEVDLTNTMLLVE